MVLVLVGLALVAAGVHLHRRHARPPGARDLPGSVVDVTTTTSTLSGSNRTLHAPTVQYTDPTTGETRTLEPTARSPRPYRVGEAVTLVHDPATGNVTLPLDRPLLQRALPFALGAACLVLGVLDLS